MTLELVHAWSDHGVDGDSGFVSVRRTQSMPGALATQLEAWSGIALDAGTLVHAHRTVDSRSGSHAVITRITANIGSAGSRPLRTSHHVALSPKEQPSIGPVTLVRSGPLIDAWSGTAEAPDGGPRLDITLPPPCQAPAIDLGWISVIAHHVLAHDPVHLLIPERVDGMDVLEAVEHELPDVHRWSMTFVCGPATRGLDVLVTCNCPHPGDQRTVLDLSRTPTQAPDPPLERTEPTPPAQPDTPQVVLDPVRRGMGTIIIVVMIVLVAVVLTWLLFGGDL